MTIDGDDDLQGLRRAGRAVADARDAMLVEAAHGVPSPARVLRSGDRFVHRSIQGGDDPPRSEASKYKLFSTELSKRLADAQMDIGGPRTQLRVGTDEAPMAGSAATSRS